MKVFDFTVHDTEDTWPLSVKLVILLHLIGKLVQYMRNCNCKRHVEI